jgi:hypothetical protein
VRAGSSLSWFGDRLALIQDDANFLVLIEPHSLQARACLQTTCYCPQSWKIPLASPFLRGTKIPAPPFFKGGWGGSPGLQTRPKLGLLTIAR